MFSNESENQEVVANNENENQEMLDNESTTDKVTTNEVENIQQMTMKSLLQSCSYCKNDDSYADMIGCDYNTCALQWFHCMCVTT